MQQYLARIGKVNGPECLLCLDEEIDSVQHTIADCEFFEYERRKLREKIAEADALKGMVAATLKTNNNWTAVKNFIEGIMEVKEAIERTRGKGRYEAEGLDVQVIEEHFRRSFDSFEKVCEYFPLSSTDRFLRLSKNARTHQLCS